MSVLLDKPDTAGLRFDTHDDALNFAAQLVNDSKDWLAVHDLNIVKRYKEAELEIVFEFRVRPQRDKFHLVFSSIPDVGFGHTEVASDFDTTSHANHASSNRDHDFVLIPVTNFVECPQNIVASQVRLEPAKERLDFFRQVLGPPETVGHLSNTPREGESGEFWFNFARCDCHGVGSIVEVWSGMVTHLSKTWQHYAGYDPDTEQY